MNFFSGDIEILRTKIHTKQKEMISLGVDKGLCHEDTLKASQELDSLIVHYQRFVYYFSKEKNSCNFLL